MEILNNFLSALNQFQQQIGELEDIKDYFNEKLNELPEGSTKEFFKESMKEAENGTINMRGFLENIQKLKDAN